MRRLTDLAVAALLVTTVVVTIRSFRTEETPPPEAPSPPPAPVVRDGPTEQEIALAQMKEQQEEYARRTQAEAEWRARLEAEEAQRSAEQERLNEEFRQNAERAAESSWPRAPSNNLAPVGSRPGGSTATDATRLEGRRQLAQIFSSLPGDARALLQSIDTHMKACGDQRGGQCNVSLENIGRQAIVVGRKLHAVHEIARKSWIPPGEVRELRQRAGMDDAAWDQLVRIVNQYAR